MKGVLITLVIVGYAVLSLYKRFKRTLAEGTTSVAGDTMEYEDVETSEESNFSFEESAPSNNPYFSYEYEAPAPSAKTESSKSSEVINCSVQPQSVLDWNGFNLRQAVVYQTILNNHYIDEINQ